MRLTLPLILLFVTSRPTAAQCPDGSPPPCTRRAVAAPDPKRIVVFPFRVTTGDSLLGEGVAELVAEEMNGEGAPRAVHMGTTLRAWRRAGGGLRAPLDRVAELRAARDLGAGLVVEGSVVGLGERLNLSAQVVSIPSGSARRVLPVAGPADSLPLLIERLSAGVLAASGAPPHAGTQRLSDSPAAVRAYVEGLAAFRRGRFQAAADAFDRADAIDTLFSRASFMRWMTSTWGVGYGSETARTAARRAREQRASLSPDDQIVLDAAFGDLAAKERAATLAPESPEILYFLGDYLYHSARRLGWDQALHRARVAFEQSAALDSQTTVLHHLVEIGLWTNDTALLRTAWSGYDGWVRGTDPSLGWLVARRVGDEGMLATLRRRPQPAGTEDDYLRAFFWLLDGSQFLTPADIDELYSRTEQAVIPPLQPVLRLWYLFAHSQQGRGAAAGAFSAESIVDTAFERGFRPDLWWAAAPLVGLEGRASGEAALARLRTASPGDRDAEARTRCVFRLWGAIMEDTIAPDDDGALRQDGQGTCADLLDALSAQRLHRSDQIERLQRADSTLRGNDINDVLFPFSGIGQVLLARCWEIAGDRRHALALLRSSSLGFPDWSLAARRRAEGRLAALEADTAGAILAYRDYLALRRFADSAFVSQRDSVRAELERLTERR